MCSGDGLIHEYLNGKFVISYLMKLSLNTKIYIYKNFNE
jgi:hypothetical protein